MNSFADAAIYPGSFDPITFGHLNILERALGIFSQVTLLVAINPNKKPLFRWRRVGR